jgi:fucose 4-O-acetylase-like acetyltransferase
MELNKFEILIGETSTSNHGHTVTSASVSGCAAEVSTAISTSSQNSVVSQESMQGAVLLVVGKNTAALAVLHDQVQSKILDEVVGVVGKGLAVERVKQSVTRSVSSSAASVGLATLAELL